MSQGTRDKRVLFLTHVGDPGGAEYKMVELCRAVRSSAEVMLFQNGSLEKILADEQIRFSVCPMPAAARTVRREGGLVGALKAVPATLSMLRAVARKARAFDVVVCISQKSFVIASLAKPLMRRPILWFMNDILSPEHFSRSLIRLLMLLSRYSADHVALNSQASLEMWRRSGGRERHVSIIYPGTHEDAIAAQLGDSLRIALHRERFTPDHRPLIGMFGRISRWKGQEVFLRAVALIPDVHAVIVGAAHFDEQAHEQELKRLTRELALEDRVTFAGHINDVISLMAACDVVAHCSTAPEPFGQVIVQAMFAGTPVIASDGGGAREIVTHERTGQLTPRSDHRALATAIQRYLQNPQWSRRVARLARIEAAEKFSGQAMTRRFLDVLGTL